MEEGLDSSPKSSRGCNLLCGTSGSTKSKTKESQPHSHNAIRKSPQKQTTENSAHPADGEEILPSHRSLESSPIAKAEASISEGPSAASQDPRVNKPTLSQRWKNFWKAGKGSPKEPGDGRMSSKMRKGLNSTRVHDEQGSSENAVLIPETSATSSSFMKSKSAKHGHLSEIKPNIVSERRAAFANASVEQPAKPSLEQLPAKTASRKTVADQDSIHPGTSASMGNKLSGEEQPSCSSQNVQLEQLSSSSVELQPADDESGTKAEKKKHSKHSMSSLFQRFTSKRTNRENVKNAQEKKSKGKNKNKAKDKEEADDDATKTSEANNSKDVCLEVTGKSQSESKAGIVVKDAKQGKTGKSGKPQSSLLQEQKKAHDSMMKAIRKRVKDLTVPELPESAIVKSFPAIPREAASAAVDSPSEQRHVEIPKCDDNEVFFPTPKNNADQLNDPSAIADHLDVVKREPILQSAKKATPVRKGKTSGNPVRKMAERGDLVTSYEEKQPNVKPTANFTKEALDGLKSTEDFNVKLKSVHSSSPSHVSQNQPFKEQMLLLVKGRKLCHARLVEPCAKSINAGDSYVLVMPNSVHVWIGHSSNIHEKPKAKDVARQIVVKRDLGCEVSSEPIVIGEETKHNLKLARDFWSILGEKEVPKVQEKGPEEEDEKYEKSVNETNVVYKVSGTRLEPLEEYCGRILSHEMLNTNASAVLIFDFGGEMYVWIGKESGKAEKLYGMQLAEELWKKGYDYTSFRMNPLSPLHDKKNGGLPLKGHVRPAWALLGKLNQGMETILFKEKFNNWPGQNRIIQCQMSPQSESKDDPFVELKPCDVDKMIKSKREPDSFMWDGIRIGRCRTWVDEAYGLKKDYELETQGFDVWHVAEFACNEVDQAYHGQFFDGDTYVVRWRYRVNQVNVKGHGGKGQSSHPGRDKCAYFFWQGEKSSVTEKGACALMTVELDKEGGPQIRVVQNKEPSCFLALFKGQMIVHQGKKDAKSESSSKRSRLYMVRNELQDEAYLMEIPVQVENLRSRSSFLLLNAESDQLTIWHGARSPEHTRQRTRELTNTLRKWLSLKFSCEQKMSEKEVNEGSENAEFWKIMGSSDRSRYDSLLKSSVSGSLHRAFLLSGVTLSFEATEIVNPSLNEDLFCPFPVFQSDLYGRAQPALFLIDSGDVVYLWQGYWPLESKATENLKTGFAGYRFTAERLCAMETVLAYCKAAYPSKTPPAYVVYAGVEPVAFTNLFPSWHTYETARTSSLEDGKKLGEMEDVTQILAKMKKNQYTLAELQSQPPPDGVNPLKLESYLTDEQFKKVFDCDKDEFYSLPSWKQTEIKKNFGLSG